MYGRIQNIQLDTIPRYDLQKQSYVTVPTKKWFEGVTQKLPAEELRQLGGPSINYPNWRNELLAFFPNITTAIEWALLERFADTCHHHRMKDVDLEEKVLGKEGYFSNLMIGFFNYQIFSHLFGPRLFLPPIMAGFKKAKKLSADSTCRDNPYHRWPFAPGEETAQFIMPTIRQYPPYRQLYW